MKQTSVSELKGKWGGHKDPLPREGSRLRQVHDWLAEHRGRMVELPWDELGGQRAVSNSIDLLRQWYGLDVRLDRHYYKRDGRRGKQIVRATKACLAGEWDQRGCYVDYVADARRAGDLGEEDFLEEYPS